MGEMGFSFFSQKGNFSLSINEANQSSSIFYRELMLIFSSVDYENKIVNFEACQSKTEDLYYKIENFVNFYKGKVPQIFNLYSYVKKLSDKEFFYVLPNQYHDIDSDISFYITESLGLLNEGYTSEQISKILEEKKQSLDEIFGDLKRDYLIINISGDRKVKIGETNKDIRVCRFCGKSKKEGVTFSKIAHAIPEALGNKNIINNEECDTCNEELEKSIERDLISHFNFFRVFWGVKGKEKVPKIKFKDNKLIGYQDGRLIINEDISSQSRDLNLPPSKIVLETYDKINFMDIYRCLCKIALGVIDSDYLQYFNETIQWIRKLNTINNDLPKIAMLINPSNFFMQPQLTLYLRKSEDFSYPFLVCELKIYTNIVVFVVPFSDRDKNDFISAAEYKVFWTKFKHYNNFCNWNFRDFSDDKEKELTFIINLEKSSVN